MRTIEAVPLATTTGYTKSALITYRQSKGNNSGRTDGNGTQSDFDGGIGRNSQQTGGAGWKYAPADPGGSIPDSTVSTGLAYGAKGIVKVNANGEDGGFGGGGGDGDQNYYGAGGGGYMGGFESSGGDQTGSQYKGYSTATGNTEDDRLGSLSFVHSSGTNVTDNGHNGETSDWNNQNNADQIKGRVHLVIREI